MVKFEQASRKEIWDHIVKKYEEKLQDTVNEMIPILEIYEHAVKESNLSRVRETYTMMSQIQPQTKDGAIVLAEAIATMGEKILEMRGEI